jgi:hypothetical protein
MLEKALEFRKQPGKEGLFTDLFYKDLVKRPVHELSRLYSMNGGLSRELAEKFHRTDREHPHRKHGTHVYSAGDFGLQKKDIDHHTHHYQEFIRHLHGKEEEPV